MNKGRKEEKIGKAIIVAHQTKEGRKDDYYDDADLRFVKNLHDRIFGPIYPSQRQNLLPTLE